MVFGYYHITMRTVGRGILPEVDRIPTAQIKEKVKIAHMLWIPFFPLGKVWVMENQGQMYTMNPAAVSVLEQTVGRSRNPWYSFLGLIAIPVIYMFFTVGNFFEDRARTKRYKASFEKTLTTNMNAVENPESSDLFFFKDSKYKNLAVKVNYDTQDSVYFLAPADNEGKKWGSRNWAAGYYMGENATKEVAFAKSDLKKTFANSYGESMSRKGMDAGALPLTGLIKLEKVEKIDKTQDIPVVDQGALDRVRADFSKFVEHGNKLDSLTNYMDKASHDFYDNVLVQAVKEDKEVIAFIKQNSKIHDSLYELMLYTKYMYVNSKGWNAEEGLSGDWSKKKSYMFFLQLLDRGLLTFSPDHLKKVQIRSVNIPKKGVANVSLQAPSNMLEKTTPIYFNVVMNEENGQWKINMPSTYSYSENQVAKTGFSSKAHQSWRALVRKNYSEGKENATIPLIWHY